MGTVGGGAISTRSAVSSSAPCGHFAHGLQEGANNKKTRQSGQVSRNDFLRTGLTTKKRGSRGGCRVTFFRGLRKGE